MKLETHPRCLPQSRIFVDYFPKGTEEGIVLLSHAHHDHLRGLSKTWVKLHSVNYLVVCSETTLAILHELGFSPKNVLTAVPGKWYAVSSWNTVLPQGEGGRPEGVQIMAAPSLHTWGALMFLVKVPKDRTSFEGHLYTGDIPDVLETRKTIRHLINKLPGVRVNVLYDRGFDAGSDGDSDGRSIFRLSRILARRLLREKELHLLSGVTGPEIIWWGLEHCLPRQIDWILASKPTTAHQRAIWQSMRLPRRTHSKYKVHIHFEKPRKGKRVSRAPMITFGCTACVLLPNSPVKPDYQICFHPVNPNKFETFLKDLLGENLGELYSYPSIT